MTLDNARQLIGAAVIYRPHSNARPENGTIVSVNHAYVFVRYGRNGSPKATHPADLTLHRIAP